MAEGAGHAQEKTTTNRTRNKAPALRSSPLSLLTSGLTSVASVLIKL
ncbi:MAG TPA: hypothetical protein VFI73_02320 [Candidatus Nitrosopolaris sp.]|nr:hypothetical protein [Candidatus Nitrosopolaris sp.]